MKNTKTKVTRIPITEARVNLGAVVKRVHLGGEYFILEKDGIPIAGMMPTAELEDYLERRGPRVENDIKEVRGQGRGEAKPQSTRRKILKHKSRTRHA